MLNGHTNSIVDINHAVGNLSGAQGHFSESIKWLNDKTLLHEQVG